MAITFNANEIFAMAEQIETNGGKFYRQAADVVSDAEAKKTLLHLASMEDEHERFFAELREKLNSDTAALAQFDPDDITSAYLKAFADGYVFEADKDSTWKFSGDETPEEIIRTAIGFEKDAIVLFLGLKDAVPHGLGKDQIDALIKEEQQHIVILTKQLTALKKKHD